MALADPGGVVLAVDSWTDLTDEFSLDAETRYVIQNLTQTSAFVVIVTSVEPVSLTPFGRRNVPVKHSISVRMKAGQKVWARADTEPIEISIDESA